MPADAQSLVELCTGRGYAGISRRGIKECIAADAGQYVGGASPPPGVTFSYTPATAVISWTDKNGTFTGNLAYFYANADIASVFDIECGPSGKPISGFSSIINIASLPALTSLGIGTGTPGNTLNSVDLTGCTKLTLVNISYCVNVTTLDLSPCPNVTQLDTDDNYSLTSLTITGCTKLLNLNLNGSALSVATVNTVLEILAANGLSNGSLQINAQTPAAPPSGAGITAKATLITRGWMVQTD
jgi:hypothetical protein